MHAVVFGGSGPRVPGADVLPEPFVDELLAALALYRQVDVIEESTRRGR